MRRHPSRPPPRLPAARRGDGGEGLRLLGREIVPGETVDLRLPVSSTYTGDEQSIPLRVIRAARPGPTLLVTAAVHGDEINGTGIVHELMYTRRPELTSGTLILVPVVCLFGFETQTRYMPDRRDLNRCFPGSAGGSMSRRIAHAIFNELVKKADYGLDLHSAGSGRTNFPNVRADLTDEGCRRLAEAFGCELTVHGKGPDGSLRRAAVAAGVPMIILEAGEPSKIEPSVLEIGIRGVLSTMTELGMVEGERAGPPYRTTVRKTTWLRAKAGGLLRFHVAPGDVLEKGQPVSTNFSVYGEQQNVLRAPHDGIVLGMTTLPVVKPGEPICHLAVPDADVDEIRRALADTHRRSLDHRVRRDLATNLAVTGHGGD